MPAREPRPAGEKPRFQRYFQSSVWEGAVSGLGLPSCLRTSGSVPRATCSPPGRWRCPGCGCLLSPGPSEGRVFCYGTIAPRFPSSLLVAETDLGLRTRTSACKHGGLWQARVRAAGGEGRKVAGCPAVHLCGKGQSEVAEFGWVKPRPLSLRSPSSSAAIPGAFSGLQAGGVTHSWVWPPLGCGNPSLMQCLIERTPVLLAFHLNAVGCAPCPSPRCLWEEGSRDGCDGGKWLLTSVLPQSDFRCKGTWPCVCAGTCGRVSLVTCLVVIGKHSCSLYSHSASFVGGFVPEVFIFLSSIPRQ